MTMETPFRALRVGVNRCSVLRMFVVVLMLFPACHQGRGSSAIGVGDGHAYSSDVGDGGYAVMGVITRYDTLADCRKQRTRMTQSAEEWGPRLQTEADRRQARAFVQVVRYKT